MSTQLMKGIKDFTHDNIYSGNLNIYKAFCVVKSPYRRKKTAEMAVFCIDLHHST